LTSASYFYLWCYNHGFCRLVDSKFGNWTSLELSSWVVASSIQFTLPTRLNSTVASRRRCELGIILTLMLLHKLVQQRVWGVTGSLSLTMSWSLNWKFTAEYIG